MNFPSGEMRKVSIDLCTSAWPYIRVTFWMVPVERFQMWKYFRLPAAIMLVPEGWKWAVEMGVLRRCRDVAGGFVVPFMWWRRRVESGPEERRRGWWGWKWRVDIIDW